MFSEASKKASGPLSAPFCQVLVPSYGTGINTFLHYLILHIDQVCLHNSYSFSLNNTLYLSSYCLFHFFDNLIF